VLRQNPAHKVGAGETVSVFEGLHQFIDGKLVPEDGLCCIEIRWLLQAGAAHLGRRRGQGTDRTALGRQERQAFEAGGAEKILSRRRDAKKALAWQQGTGQPFEEIFRACVLLP
jgi:hypothetical protein